MSEDYHVPVMLAEVLEHYVIDMDGIYVDGTLGGGGHFFAVAQRLSDKGIAIGIDRDNEAIQNAIGKIDSHCVNQIKNAVDTNVGANDIRPCLTQRESDSHSVNQTNKTGLACSHSVKIILERSRFSEFDQVLRKHNIDKVSGLFVDIGVSSRQIDEPSRGFMYMKDAALDMRMDRDGGGMTAAQLLRESDEEALAKILSEYGEIRNARRMAGAIKKYMKGSPMETSADLKACIAREYGEHVKIQVLAKLFQALRIAVNDELGELKTFLEKSVKYLRLGGRVAVLSYHSLEDRMVKEFFRSAEEACICPKSQPICTCNKPITLRRVTRKAVCASQDEINKNPRSRSARLRVAERVGA